MYDIIRKIHLYSGLTILVFVVMYFLTGYLMIRHNLLPESKPVKTTVVETLEQNLSQMSTPEFAVYLQQKYDLNGKRNLPTRPWDDGSWAFNYNHPGFHARAVVSPDGKTVEITRTDQGVRGVINGFHRLHGYGGGWLYNVWAVFYDLASLAMIIFPITGFILWLRLRRDKLPGWLALGSGFALTASILFYMLFA